MGVSIANVPMTTAYCQLPLRHCLRGEGYCPDEARSEYSMRDGDIIAGAWLAVRT